MPRNLLSTLLLVWALTFQGPLAFAQDAPVDQPAVVTVDPADHIKQAIDEYLDRVVDEAVAAATEKITKAIASTHPAPDAPTDEPVVPHEDHLPPVMPSTPGLGVAVVTSDSPGGWVVLKSDPTVGFIGVDPVVLEGGTVAIWEGEPGGYAVLFFEQGKLQPKIFNVTIGGIKPPPIKPPDDPVDPTDPVEPVDPQKKTRATFVFEKDESNTPRPVALALQKLNAAGVLATEFEDDTVDGNGEVPDQYKVALAEARKAGLPALVVEVNGKVKRVIKNPRTEAEVMQAIAP